MSIGQTLRITAEVLPITATNRTVSWESSNTNVCIVDSNGLVEAVGTGSATILCKSLDGGVTAMCNIYVKQPVTSIVLNTTDITVRKDRCSGLMPHVFQRMQITSLLHGKAVMKRM